MLTAWRVEALVNYFQMVAVEVSDVGCVIARAEVRSYRWLAIARSARLNRCSVRGVDLALVVSHKPYIRSAFTGLTLVQPNAGADCNARAVGPVGQSVEIRNSRWSGG